MKHDSARQLKWAALTTGLACLTPCVQAQTGLLSSNGVVVAYSGDAVPDTTGTPIPGLNFLANGLTNFCACDESGNIFFLGTFGPTADQTNDRAYFYGSNRANLKMVIRGADQAPGLAPGILLRNASTLSSGLSSTVRSSPNGRGFSGSGLWDNGVLIVAGNENALLGGFSTSPSVLVQRGDQAPGCPAGVVYAQAFSSVSVNLSGINRNGRIYFSGSLTGTGVVTTAGSNNQVGLFTGMPGALELVARKSDPASGIPGAVTIDTAASINTVAQMNDSGNFLYDTLLSTTQGTPPATAANNWALMVHTPGPTPGTGSSAVIVREGDPAPGTSPVATFNAITGEAWQPILAPNAWTRSNQTIFTAELRGGDVTTLPNGVVNDRAIYRGGVGTLAMVVRKGDPAPGTDAFFGLPTTSQHFDVDSVMMNDNGRIVFNAFVMGGTSTTANDNGIWTGTPGSLVLVAREGDTEPITGGTIAQFNVTNTQGLHMNDQGRLLYRMNLTGGTHPGNSLWLYEPALGTSQPVLLPGNTIEVTPGVFKTIATTGIAYSELPYNNTDGTGMTLTHSGKIGLRVTFSDSTSAMMTLDLSTPSTPFCLGDGTGAACPCANTGATGRGCASATFPLGALLTSTGIAGASSPTDTLVLTATDIPGPGLFFQANGVAPSPIAFGDGLLCAAVGIIRLGVVFPTGGIASYPGGLTPNPIHMQGAPIGAGDVKHYQCWYRSVPGLCNPQNFDLTQGLTLTWGP